MKVVGIIPARYASTRFPGKPLADVAGKPMIQHVWERTVPSNSLDQVWVATEDRRIYEIVQGFGGNALLTSPDHSSGTDRLAEAARVLGLDAEDLVVNIQGDEPLVRAEMIDRLVEGIEEHPAFPMATLAYATENEGEYHDPNVVKIVTDPLGKALYFSRSPIPFHRDDISRPFTFLKHLGFYAYRHSFLQVFTRLPPGKLEQTEKLEQLRATEHGYPIRVIVSPWDTRGIDTPEDLDRLLVDFPEDLSPSSKVAP